MGEDDLIREAAAEARSLVKPVYEDVLQPTAREIGSVLVRSVRVALVPLRGLLWGWEQIEEQFIPRLIEKLKGIPEGRIVTPPLPVAGPALEAMRFTGSESALRELYANLLATAMDKDRIEQAHPAFVEIIKQLSPDEAKLLKVFPVQAQHQIPVVTLYATRESQPPDVPNRLVLSQFSAWVTTLGA
jgi:hypothetical protein